MGLIPPRIPVGFLSFLLFVLTRLLLVLFKFHRVVFLAVSLEFLILAVVLQFVAGGSSFLLLFFIWCSVVSSCFILAFLVALVKRTGRDLCYFRT